MRGISFPFRIGITGGVVMSEDRINEYTHLKEAIHQVLLTNKGERPMLPDFGGGADVSIFESDGQSSKSMITFLVKEALKEHLDDRLTVNSVNVFSEGSKIYVDIRFFSTMTDNSREDLLQTTIEVGEMI